VGKITADRKRGAAITPGGFLMLQHRMLDCEAFTRLSSQAIRMLIDIARQFNGKNNGQLLGSGAYLRTRGWTSNDMMQKARNELLEAGFLFQTVIGHRPRKASWFAITWKSLDPHKDYDAGSGGFVLDEFLPPEQRKLVKIDQKRLPNTGIKASL